MELVQMSFPYSPISRIKSYIRLLRSHHTASMAFHHRPLNSTKALASSLGELVDALEEEWEGSEEVARWATKYRELREQLGV